MNQFFWHLAHLSLFQQVVVLVIWAAMAVSVLAMFACAVIGIKVPDRDAAAKQFLIAGLASLPVAGFVGYLVRGNSGLLSNEMMAVIAFAGLLLFAAAALLARAGRNFRNGGRSDNVLTAAGLAASSGLIILLSFLMRHL